MLESFLNESETFGSLFESFIFEHITEGLAGTHLQRLHFQSLRRQNKLDHGFRIDIEEFFLPLGQLIVSCPLGRLILNIVLALLCEVIRPLDDPSKNSWADFIQSKDQFLSFIAFQFPPDWSENFGLFKIHLVLDPFRANQCDVWHDCSFTTLVYTGVIGKELFVVCCLSVYMEVEHITSLVSYRQRNDDLLITIYCLEMVIAHIDVL